MKKTDKATRGKRTAVRKGKDVRRERAGDDSEQYLSITIRYVLDLRGIYVANSNSAKAIDATYAVRCVGGGTPKQYTVRVEPNNWIELTTCPPQPHLPSVTYIKSSYA
jgi:hypothetical protein